MNIIGNLSSKEWIGILFTCALAVLVIGYIVLEEIEEHQIEQIEARREAAEPKHVWFATGGHSRAHDLRRAINNMPDFPHGLKVTECIPPFGADVRYWDVYSCIGEQTDKQFLYLLERMK